MLFFSSSTKRRSRSADNTRHDMLVMSEGPLNHSPPSCACLDTMLILCMKCWVRSRSRACRCLLNVSKALSIDKEEYVTYLASARFCRTCCTFVVLLGSRRCRSIGWERLRTSSFSRIVSCRLSCTYMDVSSLVLSNLKANTYALLFCQMFLFQRPVFVSDRLDDGGLTAGQCFSVKHILGT